MLFAPPAYAGAWAQEDGGLYVQLAVAGERASEQFKKNGETFRLLSEDEKGSFTSLGTFLYAEYGLLPSFTLVTSSAFRHVELDSDQIASTARGFGDFFVGGRYQFLDGPVVVSALLGAKYPTGYTPDPPELRAATLGNGVQEYEGRLLVAKSFHPAPIYASGEVGYRLRGSRANASGGTVDYPPEIPYFLEVGWAPLDWMWLRGVADGVWGTGDPVALDSISLTPTTQQYLKVGPSLIVSFLDDYQVQLDYTYTVMGINALQSQQLTVGLAVDTNL
ncbi:MAG: hypothetical protein ACLFVJ_10870 [Persicimonas sp.]